MFYFVFYVAVYILTIIVMRGCEFSLESASKLNPNLSKYLHTNIAPETICE